MIAFKQPNFANGARIIADAPGNSFMLWLNYSFALFQAGLLASTAPAVGGTQYIVIATCDAAGNAQIWVNGGGYASGNIGA